MKWLMLVWGLIWLFGLMTFATSQSAIHEAVSGVAFVIGTLGLGFFGTIGAVEHAAGDLGKKLAPTPAPKAEPAEPLKDDTPIG